MLEGFSFGNKNKRRPEISKNDRQSFFQIFFSKFWSLLVLNMLYFICIVPVVTFGPATCAMTKVLRNYSQERSVFLFTDFFSAFKSNFKQSFFVGIFDIASIIGYYYAFTYYIPMLIENSISYLLIFSCLIISLIIFIMAHFYIYLMIVSITLPLGSILKNSLILAIAEMKANAIPLLVSLVIFVAAYLFLPISLLFLPVFPFAFMGLVICYKSYPVIRKHIIQPYYDRMGELNPEFEYMRVTGNECKPKE